MCKTEIVAPKDDFLNLDSFHWCEKNECEMRMNFSHQNNYCLDFARSICIFEVLVLVCHERTAIKRTRNYTHIKKSWKFDVTKRMMAVGFCSSLDVVVGKVFFIWKIRSNVFERLILPLIFSQWGKNQKSPF